MHNHAINTWFLRQAPIDLLKKTVELGRLPVVNFAAGGLGKFYLILRYTCIDGLAYN